MYSEGVLTVSRLGTYAACRVLGGSVGYVALEKSPALLSAAPCAEGSPLAPPGAGTRHRQHGGLPAGVSAAVQHVAVQLR